MAHIAAKIKNNPQYQSLLAVFNDDAKALEAFNRIQPKPEVEAEAPADKRAQLLAAGFTPEQVDKALADDAPLEVEVPPTGKEKAAALVEERGFTWTKGRVYATPLLAEAIIRVHRGSKAEIVPSSGVGRTKGVLVYQEDSGDVALQNLTKEDA